MNPDRGAVAARVARHAEAARAVDATGASDAIVVLCGASNLIRGFPWVLESARAAVAPRRPRFLVAAGVGRAYAVPSRVLWRVRSAIPDSGIWAALDRERVRAPTAPVYALVTDIGNDLAYGAPAPQIANAVRTCLDRLAAAGARSLLTRVPLRSIARLSSARFRLLGSLLFPRHHLSRGALLDEAQTLNALLENLCAATGCPSCELAPEQFGWDRIHLGWSARRHAWSDLFRGWGSQSKPAEPSSTGRRLARRRHASILGAARPQRQLGPGVTLEQF